MGRHKKTPDTESTQATLDPAQTGPIPVKVVEREAPPNPYIGKFPWEDEPLEEAKYQFTYNQNPGCPMEFTRGITVLKRSTQRPGTIYKDFCLEDGSTYMLPVVVAKFLQKLTYLENGQTRPRCTLIEVD